METKDYLGYIAHFWKNLGQLVSRSDFIHFLSINLGPNMFDAPLPKIRDTARLLYKGYVVQQYTKYSAFHVVSTLDSKTIDLYLAEVIALNKKYNLFYDTVDYNFTISVMDKHIKNSALANYKSAISELTDELKPNKISKAKAKAKVGSPKVKAKTKAKAKVGSPKAKVKAKAKAKVGSPKAKVKAKAKAKVGSPKAKAKAKAKKGCDDYSMTDLRSMASTFKIAGASKMRKTELCNVLGI